MLHRLEKDPANFRPLHELLLRRALRPCPARSALAMAG